MPALWAYVPGGDLARARLFLTHLQDVGLIDGSTASPVGTPSAITEFRQWMPEQRGTCESTVSNHEVHVRELLTRVGEDPIRTTRTDTSIRKVQALAAKAAKAGHKVPQIVLDRWSFEGFGASCSRLSRSR